MRILFLLLLSLSAGAAELVVEYGPENGLTIATETGATIVRDFPVIKTMVVQGDDNTLVALLQHPRVISATSTSTIRIEPQWTKAITAMELPPNYHTLGRGVNIALVDSGTYGNSGPPPPFTETWQYEIEMGNPNPLPGSPPEGLHGAYMALIAARSSGAGIIMLDVTDGDPSNSLTVLSILTALNWVAISHAQENIKVVNLSLGTNTKYNHGCRDFLNNSIEALHSKDIIMVAASGNDKARGVLGSPACHNKVISVAASYNKGLTLHTGSCTEWMRTDRIWCGSDMSGAIDIVAPGCSIDTDALYDYGSGFPINSCGTSASAVIVSSAAAVALDKGIPPADVLGVLTGGMEKITLRDIPDWEIPLLNFKKLLENIDDYHNPPPPEPDPEEGLVPEQADTNQPEDVPTWFERARENFQRMFWGLN